MRRAQGTAARATANKALLGAIGSANIAYLAGRIGDARPHRHRVRDGAPARGVVLFRATGEKELFTRTQWPARQCCRLHRLSQSGDLATHTVYVELFYWGCAERAEYLISWRRAAHVLGLRRTRRTRKSLQMRCSMRVLLTTRLNQRAGAASSGVGTSATRWYNAPGCASPFDPCRGVQAGKEEQATSCVLSSKPTSPTNASVCSEGRPRRRTAATRTSSWPSGRRRNHFAPRSASLDKSASYAPPRPNPAASPARLSSPAGTIANVASRRYHLSAAA